MRTVHFCGLEPLGPRTVLNLYVNDIAKDSLKPEAPSEPAAARHRDFFADGWSPLLAGALKQHVNRWGGPARRERTVLIPNLVIDKLAKAAEVAGLRVTKHDLLLA